MLNFADCKIIDRKHYVRDTWLNAPATDGVVAPFASNWNSLILQNMGELQIPILRR